VVWIDRALPFGHMSAGGPGQLIFTLARVCRQRALTFCLCEYPNGKLSSMPPCECRDGESGMAGGGRRSGGRRGVSLGVVRES
jgi:hypothetical protein